MHTAPAADPEAPPSINPSMEDLFMKTFTSLSDLSQLADDDPAKPVVRQLLEWLIAPGDFPDHPYVWKHVIVTAQGKRPLQRN